MTRRSLLLACIVMMFATMAGAFVPVNPAVSRTRATFMPSSTLLKMDPSEIISTVSSSDHSLLLAETEGWVQPLAFVLDPFLNLLSFAMLCRVVLSWYPTTNLNELPWNLVAWPTEPLLKAIRGTVPPAFGVDITPIVWLAVFTFFHEVLLGQQGLLTMKIKYGI